jgi:hypothetical protein
MLFHVCLSIVMSSVTASASEPPAKSMRLPMLGFGRLFDGDCVSATLLGLPHDTQSIVRSYVGYEDIISYESVMAHRSFRKFLSEFVRLNKSGSEREARDSFYKHNNVKLDTVLSLPYFGSDEFITALWSNQPLPASEALDQLHAICNAYLSVLRYVDARIARFLANPESKLLSLRDNLVTDLSRLSGLTGLKVLYLERIPVTDLSPLSGLTGLERLYLYRTPADRTVLGHLTNLRIFG